jgi:hypothetical protein
MKQSGFDGLVVALAIAAAAGGRARRRLARIGLVVAGAAVPLVAAAIDGAAAGWSNYTQAVVGYRASQDLGGRFGARPGLFAGSLSSARLDLTILLCVAVGGAIYCLRRRDGSYVAPLWLAAAFAGFNLGGLYWPHYYVQLVPPLALLAGIAVSVIRARPLRIALAAAAVAPVVVTLASWLPDLLGGPHSKIPFAKSYSRDTKIASFIRAHSSPADRIYALISEGDLYFIADRPAGYRYLWAHPLQEIRGALAGLSATLDGAQRPKFVILYRDPGLVDPSGRLSTVVRRNYRLVWRVSPTGTRVLQARAGQRKTPV